MQNLFIILEKLKIDFKIQTFKKKCGKVYNQFYSRLRLIIISIFNAQKLVKYTKIKAFF